MKCSFCNQDFSDSVMLHHEDRCEAREAESKDDKEASEELIALREKAKALGIKNTGSKKLETLMKEIAEIEGKSTE
jgi:hypothetical protein